MPKGDTIAFLANGVTNAFRQREKLRKWLRAVAKDHRRAIGQLTYVLMSDEALLEYNSRYLQHDTYTDVITFPHEDDPNISGDILISYDRVRENAKTYGVTAQQELHRVMVHGLLHLLGHSDENPAKRKAMREEEDKYLARLK